MLFFFFFQAEDGIRDWSVTGVQTCALPISHPDAASRVGDGPHMVGSRVKNSTRYLRQRRCVIPDNPAVIRIVVRSEEHTSELQSLTNLVCRLLLEKKKNK